MAISQFPQGSVPPVENGLARFAEPELPADDGRVRVVEVRAAHGAPLVHLEVIPAYFEFQSVQLVPSTPSDFNFAGPGDEAAWTSHKVCVNNVKVWRKFSRDSNPQKTRIHHSL